MHGSNSIPNYPASHGCVRVSVPAMDWIWAWNLMPMDIPVWVHGQIPRNGLGIRLQHRVRSTCPRVAMKSASMLNRSRPTVADIRANKGKRQMTMVHIENRDEARACAAAGIDVLSIETPIWDVGMREAAGDVFVQVGLQYGQLQTTDDYLRGAHDAMQHRRRLLLLRRQHADRRAARRQEGVPIVGHVGLIPARRTWTGGFKAVGKTLDTAKLVYQQVKALENAGAFAAEIEVVPERITDRDRQAHVARAVLDGRRHRRRRPVPVLDRHPRLQRLVDTAPLQAVPRLPRRVRPAAGRTGRRRSASSSPTSTSGEYPQPEHVVPVADDVHAEFVDYLDTVD